MTLRSPRLAAIVAGALTLLAAGSAAAQSSSTTAANGTMTLYQPITLSKTSDMTFGTLIRPTTGNGNATIDATSGNLTATGGIGIVTSSTHTRAAFAVSGEGGLNFTVTIPASFTLTHNGAQDPIQVTLTSTAASGTLSNALGTTGTSAFGVGGQILLSNGTPSGAYSGSFAVTVAYN